MDQHLDAVFTLRPTDLPVESGASAPQGESPPQSHQGHDSAVSKGLRALTHLAATFPLFVLILIALACGLCSLYATKQLGFKTKRADLISPNADYHKRWIAFTEGFGDVADMVVVVDGQDPDTIKKAMDDLGEQLHREPESFSDILYKVDTRHLQAKGLQYLPDDKVESLLQRVEQLAPLLRNNCKWLTLNRIYQGVRLKLGDRQDPSEAVAQIRMATSLTESLSDFCGSKEYNSPWDGLFQLDAGEVQSRTGITYNLNQKETLGFVLVKPVSTDEGFEGAKRSVERLRDVLKDLGETHTKIKFGLTGIPVLEYDEMQASQTAMMWESIFSYSGVGILLVLGFRGLRFPVMALMMLGVATSWSFGFTTGTIHRIIGFHFR